MLQKDKKKEEEETLRLRSTIDESSNGVEGCRKYRGRALSFFFFFWRRKSGTARLGLACGDFWRSGVLSD